MGNAEVMVTARMGVGKKEEGNRVLASLGPNASKAVNQLYDYVIERGVLPFDDRVEERRPHSRAEVEAAVGLVDSLVAPVAEPYRSMSTKDARLARLGIAGAAGEGRR